nr:response regulator [Brucella pituitosa]
MSGCRASSACTCRPVDSYVDNWTKGRLPTRPSHVIVRDGHLGGHVKIAIVDDDGSVRKALARVLATEDIETSTYASGPEFLISLSEQIPDCLMLDIQMPGMNGPEVQRRLRESGFSMPIIIITGNDDSSFVRHMIEAGAIACFSKPVDIRLLLDTIRRAVVRN